MTPQVRHILSLIDNAETREEKMTAYRAMRDITAESEHLLSYDGREWLHYKSYEWPDGYCTFDAERIGYMSLYDAWVHGFRRLVESRRVW